MVWTISTFLSLFRHNYGVALLLSCSIMILEWLLFFNIGIMWNFLSSTEHLGLALVSAWPSPGCQGLLWSHQRELPQNRLATSMLLSTLVPTYSFLILRKYPTQGQPIHFHTRSYPFSYSRSSLQSFSVSLLHHFFLPLLEHSYECSNMLLLFPS